VVEINDHYRKATTLSLDSEKNLSVGNTLHESAEQEGASLKKFFSSLRIPKRGEVIIGLDAARAVTIPVSAELVRDNAKEEIRGEELANLVSQAVWRSLNRYRGLAAGRLAVADSDIVLANLRVLGVRVDGYRVINPLGFKAKRVEFEIEQVFTTRTLAEEIREALRGRDAHAFILETGAALARLLSRSTEDGQFVLACMDENGSALYRISRRSHYIGSISLPGLEYLGGLPWGNALVREAFASHFNIGSAVARDIVHAFCARDVSAHGERYLHKLFEDALSPLIHSTKTKLKGKEMVYWNSYEYPLPDYAAKKEGLLMKGVNCLHFVDRLGFKIAVSRGKEATWRSAVPLFLDFYFFEEDYSLNVLANQRARWLIS
jgi:hypothetical protein